MAIVLTKLRYCYKMSNFSPSGISCLTCSVTTNVIKVSYCNLSGFFSRFSNRFLLGQFKKKHEKNFLKKKTIHNFVLKFLLGSDLCDFFSRFSFFSKVILLICGNITVLYITR